MNDMVTARLTSPHAEHAQPHPHGHQHGRQQLLARYNADSLEMMTPAQLRDAVDYLLADAAGAATKASPDRAAADQAPSDQKATDALPLAAQPMRYEMETSLIDLGAALSEASRNFKQLERRFYLAAFGRYED